MQFPGPPQLGRGAIVPQGTNPPHQLADAAVFDVDCDDLSNAEQLVREMRPLWRKRTPYVVRLAGDPSNLTQVSGEPGPVWRLGDDYTPWVEHLSLYVWSNNWDLRSGEPIWWWARKAHRQWEGRLCDSEAGDVAAGPKDIIIDGGPRGTFSTVDGVALWHRDHVELGSTGLEADQQSTAHLAADQKAAVEAAIDGPVRVIAPAGSGKTRVLTARICHLVADRGVDPRLICAVAYNTRAAEELQERLEEALGEAGRQVQVRTVHSLAYSILRQHRDVKVVGERDVRNRISHLIDDPPQARDPYASYLSALAEVRLGLKNPVDVETQRGDVPGFAHMFEAYRHGLRTAGLVDFDEQVYAAIGALISNPQLRKTQQLRCRYLCIDEFQDFTPAFVLFTRLLAGPEQRVFAVGDDDQTIYSYTGANPKFLVEFDRWFPHANHHALETNYRCPADVVAAASTLLSNNSVRVPKTIRAGRDDQGLCVEDVSADDQAKRAAELVEGWVSAGVNPSDIAVLTRVNSTLLGVQTALAQRNIAADAAVGSSFMDRTGVRTALCYLRLSDPDSPWIGSDLEEVANRPVRMSGQMRRKLASKATWSSDELKGLGDGGRKLVTDLAALVAKRRSGASTADLLRAIITLVSDDLDSLDATRPGAGAGHLDDLEALRQASLGKTDPEDFERWLRGELSSGRGPGGGVTLATVHRTKGLEWPYVVVLGANPPLMPHDLSDDISEERRIFHVAITRTAGKLVVLSDNTTRGFAAEMAGGSAAAGSGKRTRVARSSRPKQGRGPSGSGRVRTSKMSGLPRNRSFSKSGGGTAKSGTRLFSDAAKSAAAQRRSSKPKSVVGRVGAVIDDGGVAGTIVDAGPTGATVQVSGGAKLVVKWGRRVTVDGETGVLVAP